MNNAQRRIFNLIVPKYDIISDAVKTTGSYAPEEIMCFIEERLTLPQHEAIEGFLKWIVSGTNRHFGSGNFKQRVEEYALTR